MVDSGRPDPSPTRLSFISSGRARETNTSGRHSILLGREYGVAHPRVLVLAGDHWINWDMPDCVCRVRFTCGQELMLFPDWIRSGAESCAFVDTIVVSPGYDFSNSKKFLRTWALDLANAIFMHSDVSRIMFVTQNPRKDSQKMSVIKFNANLAAAVGCVDRSSPLLVEYVAAHKFVLQEIDYPIDGILGAAEMRQVRKFVLCKMGLAFH